MLFASLCIFIRGPHIFSRLHTHSGIKRLLKHTRNQVGGSIAIPIWPTCCKALTVGSLCHLDVGLVEGLELARCYTSRWWGFDQESKDISHQPRLKYLTNKNQKIETQWHLVHLISWVVTHLCFGAMRCVPFFLILYLESPVYRGHKKLVQKSWVMVSWYILW